MENLEFYVGYLLSNIIYKELGYWHSEIEDLVQGTIEIKDIEDLDQLDEWHKVFVNHSDGIKSVLSPKAYNIYNELYSQISIRKEKLRYIYFCNDRELPKHYYSSLQKFKNELQ